MTILSKRAGIVLLRLYAIAVLLTAALLSPAELSIIPLAVLAFLLISWRWRLPHLGQAVATSLVYFSVAILLAGALGHPEGFTLALPLLLLLDHTLRDAPSDSEPGTKQPGRRLTQVGVALYVSTPVLLILGLLLDNAALALAGGTAFIYLGAVGIYSIKNLSLNPLEVEVVRPRILAGKTESFTVHLISKAKAGGWFRLFSSCDWVVLDSHQIALVYGTNNIQLTVKPTFSGPQRILLRGYCLDRWGLSRVDFEIEPAAPVIIPRARYAAWLAKKFLAGSYPGMSTGIKAFKSLSEMGHGLEYYGSRLYQPGDSLKNIDWKHSFKYNELTSREFIEPQGQPVLMLINLAAGGTEQADRLAFDIISGAISLAVEKLPASIAAYNGEKVVTVTGPLNSVKLVSCALDLIERIRVIPFPARYLNPPDLANMKSNLARLRILPGQAARTLEELMQVEYANLHRSAIGSVATEALMKGLARTGRPCTVAVISGRNHDAEALSYLTLSIAKDKRIAITAI